MKAKNKDYFKLLVIGIVILKALLYLLFYHEGDLLFRAYWVDAVRGRPLGDAYFQFENLKNTRVPVDYPPIYVYYVYVLSFIPKLFDFDAMLNFGLTIAEVWLMKLPTLICEICTILFIYKKIDKKLATFILILPLNIISCSTFGDNEIVLMLFIIITLYYLHKDKMYIAAIFVGIALCIKPQAVYFVIALLIYLIMNKSNIVVKLKTLCISAITFYILWLPYIIYRQDILFPIKYYIGVSSRWDSVSRGAFNLTTFYSIFRDLLLKSSGISNIEHALNYVIILCICILGILIYKRTDNFLLMMAFIWITIYSVTLNQQNRYIYFPLMILMYLVYKCKLNKELSDTVKHIYYLFCVQLFISKIVEDFTNLMPFYMIAHLICTTYYAFLYFNFNLYLYRFLIKQKDKENKQ